jgi:hypothetical protein
MTSFSEATTIHAPSAFHRSVTRDSVAIHSVIGRDVAGDKGSFSVDAKSTVSDGSFALRKVQEITRWSPYVESQFQEYVARRADGNASSQDLARLNYLRKARQRLKNPLKADQILIDFRARELRKQALEAVQAYAQFIQGSSSKSKA